MGEDGTGSAGQFTQDFLLQLSYHFKEVRLFFLQNTTWFYFQWKKPKQNTKNNHEKVCLKEKKNVVVYSCLGFFLRKKSNLKGTLPCLITCC